MNRRNVSLIRSVARSLACGLILTAAAPAAAADDAAAPAPVADTRAASCLERARVDAPAAREAAEKWLRDEAGGPPAELCLAMALFHAGAFAESAERLEKLATAEPAPGPAARLLAQAGWARLRAGAPDAADRLYGLALDKRPDDADLWIDRAFARAEAERYWDAVTDLERAMALTPTRPEPFIYRAAAYKALGQPRAALADLERALELRPDDPQAVLLRANVKAESGDLAGAEADWTLAARLDKDGNAGRAAAANLDRLRQGAATQEQEKKK